MTLPFAVRLRAHSAGLEAVVQRLIAAAPGERLADDLLALVKGPLPLLGALASSAMHKEASVVGLLPVEILADPKATAEKALAHRAAAEAEVLELTAASAASDVLDVATEALRTLLAKLRGATARIDETSLNTLASAAGVSVETAAARLADAGVIAVTRLCAKPGNGAMELGPLPVRESLVVPSAIDDAWISKLLSAGPRPVALVAGPDTTGIELLRASAISRIAGFGPISVGGADELKGPDGCLAFGADRLEAQLDPPGSMGSRTRAYGEAAIHGAQLAVEPPSRRAPATKRLAHILDDDVDPSLLPGGDRPVPPPAKSQAPEVRS